MSQKNEVLKYLKRHKKGITVWTAFELGVTRLSERIRELEADGFLFDRTALYGENRFGNRVRIIRYTLIGSTV